MPDTFTPNLNLTKPEVGGSEDTWGIKVNSDLDILDELLDETTGHKHNGVAGEGPVLQPPALGVGGVGLVTSASGTQFVARTLLASLGVKVTNGDGVGGNPAFELDLASLIAAASAADASEIAAAIGGVTKKLTRANLLNGALLTSPRHKILNLGSGSGLRTIPLDQGSRVIAQVTGVCTWVFSGIPATEYFEFVLKLINGGTGANVWPASVKWPSAAPPTFVVNGVDILVFRSWDQGTTWNAFREQADSR